MRTRSAPWGPPWGALKSFEMHLLWGTISSFRCTHIYDTHTHIYILYNISGYVYIYINPHPELLRSNFIRNCLSPPVLVPNATLLVTLWDAAQDKGDHESLWIFLAHIRRRYIPKTQRWHVKSTKEAAFQDRNWETFHPVYIYHLSLFPLIYLRVT